MKCQVVRLPGGETAIVCGRGPRPQKCSAPGCGRLSVALCDWPVSDHRTCDKRLCAEHRVKQGPNRDFCPEHASEHGQMALALETLSAAGRVT